MVLIAQVLPVPLEVQEPLSTRGNEARVERVIGHAVQNALDASAEVQPVRLSLERLGRFADALERFKPLMDPEKGSGDALDASFRTAECYYHLDQYQPAIAILSSIA